MSSTTQQIIDMLNMLPKKEQDFACEMLKKIVLAWDPDYTKLTPDESKKLEEGKKQLANGEFFLDEEIDWDNLDSLDLN
ncbi:MAG TPA: hypothetical protein GX691_04200 [Clostridia bacterium]|nr:hypothetical protein [Clostridia bacterium]